MREKKNSTVDISDKQSLYFQVALLFVLWLIYMLINFKVYDKKRPSISGIPLYGIGNYVLDGDFEEEVPPTEFGKLAPPPPPIAPPEPVVETVSEKIKIVKDESKVLETILESTEMEENEETVTEEPDFEGSEEFELGGISVPFSVIESVPTYPGCEKYGTDLKKRKCMMDKITRLVNRNFNTHLGNQLNLTGVNRIMVQFKIDRYGNIRDIIARGPHPKLEAEAVRVVKKIPSMRPGMQQGQPVSVVYALPIVFRVE